MGEISNNPIRLSRAIVYGSIAVPLKKVEADHTHKWAVYVKGFHDENISSYIKRVCFKLHESFQNPNRIVESFPFEVTETGWGEFELSIKIFFQDPFQKPLSLAHHLKLYPEGQEHQVKTTIPVISEKYEEIIFDNPSASMVKILTSESQYNDKSSSHRFRSLMEKESSTLSKLLTAKNQVESELEKLTHNITTS